jgi:hypothetical protein
LTSSVGNQDIITGLIDKVHIKKKVMHQVDHNLFDQVEVGEMGELHIMGCIVLDEVLVCGRCWEFMVFFTKLTLLFIRPRAEYCQE